MVETRSYTCWGFLCKILTSRLRISGSILSLLICTQITEFLRQISVSFNVSERGKCQSVQDDGPGKVSINIKAFTHWMRFCASCASISHKCLGDQVQIFRTFCTINKRINQSRWLCAMDSMSVSHNNNHHNGWWKFMICLSAPNNCLTRKTEHGKVSLISLAR